MSGSSLQIVASTHGIEVPAAPMLSPRIIASLNEGRYERQEVFCGLNAIAPGARILELGAGAGVVGAIIAKNRQPEAMISIEANPDLIPVITRLYAHNGLSEQIALHHRIVLSEPDAPETVSFNVAVHYLGSSLMDLPDRKSRKVEVPVWRYADLKRDHPHDVIMMDIEGGELNFFRHADLSGVTLIIVEMHRDHYGREGMRETRHLLHKAGFAMDEALSKAGVHVWRRV